MGEEKVGFRGRVRDAWAGLRGRGPTALSHSWDAFNERDQQMITKSYLGPSASYRPDRIRLRIGTERSILASLYTRIGIDVASNRIIHARLDDDDRYIETMDSGLNYCLTSEANIDQTGRALIQECASVMCDEGVSAIVPTETNINPRLEGGYNIKQLRVGKIREWFPEYVRVSVYNQKTGEREELVLPKKLVAIIPNPLYDVMNEPNSTLKRLIYKLNLLDAIDEQAGSGKLDVIIHLPYAAKTELQQKMAEERRQALEDQLAKGKYGVGYIDASERVTQLNRPVENKLMDEIEYLTSMLYSQLGMTKEVFEGVADEKTMLNYYSRTIEPFTAAICDEMNRKFLTKTARSQHQKIVFFRDLFKLAPTEIVVNSGRSLVDGEIAAPNEVRQLLGMKPSSNPDADELRNRNVSATPVGGTTSEEEIPTEDSGSSTEDPLADMRKISELVREQRKGRQG